MIDCLLTLGMSMLGKALGRLHDLSVFSTSVGNKLAKTASVLVSPY